MSDTIKYNPNIHHRKSIRLKGYDYSQAGLYFITICCQDRICRFGKIVGVENFQPEMILNDAGKIADECWLEIPKHFPNAKLHEHVVMPNHVHGIIELTDANVGVENFQPLPNKTGNIVGAENFLPLPNKTGNIVGVENFQPLQNTTSTSAGAENFLPLRQRNEFQKMIPRSIGSIVKGYKIGVTKWFRARAENFQPLQIWQRNYYEHIIRNEQSYQTISDYIINNPAKWNDDKFYKQ